MTAGDISRIKKITELHRNNAGNIVKIRLFMLKSEDENPFFAGNTIAGRLKSNRLLHIKY